MYFSKRGFVMESFLLRLYKKDASAKVAFHTSSVTYQFWIVLINLTHSLIDAPLQPK